MSGKDLGMSTPVILMLCAFAAAAITLAYQAGRDFSETPTGVSPFLVARGARMDDVDDYVVEMKNESATDSRIVAKMAGAFLRISVLEGVEEAGAIKFANDKISAVRFLYADYVSAYPGRLSRQVTCPEEFKPQPCEVAAGLNTTCLILMATERHAYGACDRSVAKNRCAISFFYCAAGKRLFQIELCAPIGEFDTVNPLGTLGTFRCLGSGVQIKKARD